MGPLWRGSEAPPVHNQGVDTDLLRIGPTHFSLRHGAQPEELTTYVRTMRDDVPDFRGGDAVTPGCWSEASTGNRCGVSGALGVPVPAARAEGQRDGVWLRWPTVSASTADKTWACVRWICFNVSMTSAMEMSPLGGGDVLVAMTMASFT